MSNSHDFFRKFTAIFDNDGKPTVVKEGWDDEAGYDTEDPKHPDYAERTAEEGDRARKEKKENPVKESSTSQMLRKYADILEGKADDLADKRKEKEDNDWWGSKEKSDKKPAAKKVAGKSYGGSKQDDDNKEDYSATKDPEGGKKRGRPAKKKVSEAATEEREGEWKKRMREKGYTVSRTSDGYEAHNKEGKKVSSFSNTGLSDRGNVKESILKELSKVTPRTKTAESLEAEYRKLVAEAEQIDELSPATLQSYAKKSRNDQFNLAQSAARKSNVQQDSEEEKQGWLMNRKVDAAGRQDYNKMVQRNKGQALANKKLAANANPTVESEKLDELSPQTLRSYASKARGEGQWAGAGKRAPGYDQSKERSEYQMSNDMDPTAVRPNTPAAAMQKFQNKRFAGANKAVDKIAAQTGKSANDVNRSIGVSPMDTSKKGFGSGNNVATKNTPLNGRDPF